MRGWLTLHTEPTEMVGRQVLTAPTTIVFVQDKFISLRTTASLSLSVLSYLFLRNFLFKRNK